MRVDQETCTGCGECLPFCPVGAIALVDGLAEADQEACVECGVGNPLLSTRTQNRETQMTHTLRR